VFDGASASRAASFAASRKKTRERFHSGSVSDSMERLVARWFGQR
jgi:hypothetical protein